MTDDDLKKLFVVSSLVSLNPGECIIRESEKDTDFYVVISGELEIFRTDAADSNEYSLAKIHPGETVGEMSLLEAEGRAASVRAKTPALLRKFSKNDVFDLTQQNPTMNIIFIELAKSLSKRIRKANDVTVQSLRSQLDNEKIRNKMGTFLINIVGALCLFALCVQGLASLASKSVTSTYISFIVIGVSFIFFALFIKATKLPLSFFGLTTKNWRTAVKEGILFSIPLLLLGIFIKYLLTVTFPIYHDTALIHPWYPEHGAVVFGLYLSPAAVCFSSIFLYAFVGCFLQELMCRGGLQSLLNYFFNGKHPAFNAIIISNLIFSTIHVFLAFAMSVLVFIPGLYFGWLYYRHGNLIGCTISHILLGSITMFVVGFAH